MKPTIPIKLYFLLVLMLVVILITGVYGIRELNKLNEITENLYTNHIKISEEQFRKSEEIYHQAKRNSYIFLSLSLTFFILLGVYIIKKVRQLIKSLKRINNKIMQSEVKFQELMKYAGDSIFMTDLNYQITAMNESACELLGYSKEELQHMKIVELMTKEHQKTFASKIKIIDALGGSLHERKFIKKDGSLVETEVNVRAIKGIGYISVIRDITDRKATEIKLRENEERYKSIISVSKTGGWEFHGDTDFLWCSDEYFLMLGRKQSDYDFSGAKNLKETWIDLLHPEDRERAINHFAEYLKNGSIGTYESYFRMLHSDGSWVWIWSRGQTLRDPEGKLTPLTVGTHIDITERKRIEKDLIESEVRFREVLENSISASYKRNLQTNIYDYLSPVFKKIADYTQEELNNLPLETVIGLMHPDDVESVKNGITKAINELNGLANSVEYRFKHKTNGEYRWLKDEFVVMQDEQGQAVSLIGSVSDITESKKSELLFKYQFENSPDIILIINRDFTIETINKSVVSSYPVEGLIGKNSIDVLPEESREHARKAISQCFETGVTSEIENSINHNKWVRSRFVPITIDGTITHIMIIATDITERKNSEATIKEQAEIFTAIIENANEAIWLLAPDLTVLQFNKTLQERIRLNGGKEIYLGANFKDFLYTGSENEFMTMFNEALKGNYPESELCQTNIHGVLFWIRSRMYPVYDIQKKLIGVAILTENITERKTMESERQKILDEMMQRNRDLEQFTYIVSHNLRSPVANIIGISNYMHNTEMDSEESEEMNNGLRTSVLKLDGVINDLNNILKVKREISEKKEMVKFSDLVNNIKTSIVNLIEKEDVTFITDFNTTEEIETIKSYLHSIFYNLISNSIKYRRLDVAPVIEIRTNFVEGKLEITYKDNGLGIDLEKKGDQVFGLYKRFHTHAEGKGMGLYMVKTQVETLGGTISLESEINKGTTFKIKFEIEKNTN